MTGHNICFLTIKEKQISGNRLLGTRLELLRQNEIIDLLVNRLSNGQAMNTLGCKDLSNQAFVQDIYTLSLTTVNLSTLDNVQVFMKAHDIKIYQRSYKRSIKRQLACVSYSLHGCFELEL